MLGWEAQMALEPPAAPARPMAALNRKLARFTALSADEEEALSELQSAPRRIRGGREIITEGRCYDSLLVVVEGAAIRYRILHDGRRQILNIALPGDFIGFPACFFERALFSVAAVGDVLVSAIPFAALMALFGARPRLAAAILWSFSCEAAMYAERLTDVGRRSALERIAHFLLELLTRLQAVGLAQARSFRLPLTQELIGDALGLSLPHVNRTLRQLREDGLVSIKDRRVTIDDLDGLSALADFERTYLSRFRPPDRAKKRD
jgi:CRP-like cAMP-binding protein